MARGHARLSCWVAGCSLAGLLAGCAGTATIHGALPQPPLVERRAARIAVFYTGAARAAVFSNELVHVPVGQASIARLDQAFTALFGPVVHVPDWPPWRSQPPAVNGIVEVDAAEMTITNGNDAAALDVLSADLPDWVGIHYHACLYLPDGTWVQCWESRAENLHQRGVLDGYVRSIGEQADRAMTDAVASLMRMIEADPAVRDWVQSPREVEATAPPAGASQIAILWWPVTSREYDQGEVIEDCLARTIAADAPDIGIVSQESVRSALYPLLEPSTQPASEEEFGAMLARADVQARLRALRTNRLVAFTGGRTRAPAEGFVLCGYNGCLGYAWRSEGSRLDAALWDLEEARKSLALEASAQGKTRVPAFILPIPLPAQTLAQACEQLGHRIAAAITAPSTAPEPPAPTADPEAPAPGR